MLNICWESRRTLLKAWARALIRMAGAHALALAAIDLEAQPQVSWWKDITPIFKKSCNGCHHPGKLKGDVDTSTYAGFAKPGKHGPNYKAGDPATSLVVEQITGKEPDMPKEGEPLSAAEVALIERWIKEGAKDDTPPDAYSTRLKSPPVYRSAPVISSITVSPDGKWIAVSGYHEVLLLELPSLELKHRLLGESPRVESVAFAPDSKRLAVSGGAPARFGEIQIWEVETGKALQAWKMGGDSVYGVSWSPDGTSVAFGGSDKSVRVFQASDGKETMKFDNHSDWVFQTSWVAGGKRLLSGSRDRAMKLIQVANGQFIDDINKLLEPVVSMATHPKEEWSAYGGASGGLRVYKIKENQERTAANRDVNLVREFEKHPGVVHAVAWSPEGQWLAAGNERGEVRIYKSEDGKKSRTLSGHQGAVFGLAFSPDGAVLYTGGFDGLIRGFDMKEGKLLVVMTPVRVEPILQAREK
ncbi:MAG: hypothetical protein FJ404_15490 [Verrucomicrobia bacterium]|nr:hypothetical protein [Verrucomicrobiota bacterium]